MNEQEWARLVGDVIRGVEPENADRRRRIHWRLEWDGTLPVLRRASLAGGDTQAVANILYRLADVVAAELKLGDV